MRLPKNLVPHFLALGAVAVSIFCPIPVLIIPLQFAWPSAQKQTKAQTKKKEEIGTEINGETYTKVEATFRLGLVSTAAPFDVKLLKVNMTKPDKKSRKAGVQPEVESIKIEVKYDQKMFGGFLYQGGVTNNKKMVLKPGEPQNLVIGSYPYVVTFSDADAEKKTARVNIKFGA